MNRKYAVRVTLEGNALFDSERDANRAADVWLDRLAERDNAGSWEECDWEIVEVDRND